MIGELTALGAKVHSHTFIPLPGTPLHRELRDRITLHDLDYYTFTNAVYPPRLGPQRFYGLYAAMLKRFLKHVSHG
mgnify:CR=1 FL=1